jgi:integrase
MTATRTSPAVAKLTKRVVDGLLPTHRELFVLERGAGAIRGFGVRVYPSGRKVFVLQYRIAGQLRKVTIGDYGTLTCDEARARAQELKGDVAKARSTPDVLDPAAKRRAAQRAVRAVAAIPTFSVVADEFLASLDGKNRSPRTIAEYRRAVGVTLRQRGRSKGTDRVGPARAALGARRITEVARADVASLHEALRSTPVLANRTVAALGSLFKFAKQRGYIVGENLAHGLPLYAERRVERYLSDAEYARLGAVLQDAERGTLRPADDPDAPAVVVPEVAVLMVRWLIVTGWRHNEAERLTWGDIDRDRSVALLATTKGGRSARGLSAPALELLARADALAPSRASRAEAHVFPGRDGRGPFTNLAPWWDALRRAAQLEDVRVHDLRHAVGATGAGLGLSMRSIAAVLGHREVRTTERYAHLAPDALQRATDQVGQHIAAKLEGTATPVTPLRRARHA